jgi:hypothetical protein
MMGVLNREEGISEREKVGAIKVVRSAAATKGSRALIGPLEVTMLKF